MSELIEGTAEVITEEPKNVPFEELPPEKKEEIRAKLAEAQAVVAEAELRSEHGWDILIEMYKVASTKLLSTSSLTVPVMHTKEKILAKVKDPQEFNSKFGKLASDLRNYHERLVGLFKQHEHFTGAPQDHELPLIHQLADGYSNRLTELENDLETQIFEFIEYLNTEYGEELEIPRQYASHAEQDCESETTAVDGEENVNA